MRHFPLTTGVNLCGPLSAGVSMLLLGLISFSSFAQNDDDEVVINSRSLNWSGRQIMTEVYKRHQQFPYIYEEQSMVMVDRNGYRDTRKIRRYSRTEEDGTVNFMLLFDSPREVKGVALLARRDPEGKTNKEVYLPAFGTQLFESISDEEGGSFLGTDFTVENLTGESLSDYQYIRVANEKQKGVWYFVIDVYERWHHPLHNQSLRRHYIRQDNLFITKTVHYDKQGRVYKVQSHHDLRPVDGNMWRAGMILMHDEKEQHQSLIKINRRIFSRDYVPAEMFSAEWLYENYSSQQADSGETQDDDDVSLELHDEVTALIAAQEEMRE